MSHDDDETEDLQALAANVTAKAEELVVKTTQLLAEFQQLSATREANGHGVAPGLRSLVQNVSSEDAAVRKHLQKLRDGVDYDDTGVFLKRLASSLQCSNVPAIASTWDVVKRCRGLESLTLRFSRHSASGACPVCPLATKKCPAKSRQAPGDLAQVDAVVDGGAEWIRVAGISERRLLLHMAEGGWDWGSDGGSDDGAEELEEDCDVSVAVTLRQLVEAARVNRHDYRPPRVHLIFTQISEGSSFEIDRFIRLLRGLGSRGRGPAVEVIVDCANSAFLAAPPPPPDVALQNLLPDEFAGLTGALNFDCSLLVALVSDVTHVRAPAQPWHRGDVARQIGDELEHGSSLVRLLYPALRGRRLVCTPAAACRFRVIVATVGSETEAARAAVILGAEDGGLPGKSPEALVAELQGLSDHPVDPDLRLPVKVVEPRDSADDISGAIEACRLPAVARPVLSGMTELNREIFMYGWAEGVTSVTTNNTLTKQVVRLIEERRTSDEEAGPSIWVYRVMRALGGKSARPA